VSRNDEPVTPAALRAAADLTYRQHQPGEHGTPGWCWQCTSIGCPQLDWAIEVRAGGKDGNLAALLQPNGATNRAAS
jgi:hypothetical protein